MVAHGYASNAGNSLLVAFSADLTHAVHGHHGLPVGHLVLAELDHPAPDLGLASAGEQNVDLIEAELAVEQQVILLFGPVAVGFPMVFDHEAGCIRSRRRKRGRLEETGRLPPVGLHNLIEIVVHGWKCRFRSRGHVRDRMKCTRSGCGRRSAVK